MKNNLPTLYKNNQRVSKKDGTVPLYFHHEIHGKVEKFQLNIRVNPDKWNQDLQRVKDDESFTELLYDKRTEWAVFLKHCLNKGISTPEIKKIFQLQINGTEKKADKDKKKKLVMSFYDLIDRYQIENKGRKTPNYLRTFATLKVSLQNIFPHLSFNDLTYENLSRYYNYMVAEELSNATIHKYFKLMNTTVNFGRALGFTIPFNKDDFKVTVYDPVKVWLTQEEIGKLEKVWCKNEGEMKVKDWFLFRCYSGVRFSDMEHINVGNLQNGNVLTLNLQKQRKRHRLPLALKALAILHKYKKWPFISQQNENRIIKDLAKRAKLKREIQHYKWSGTKLITYNNKLHEIISTHDARRTFGRLAYEKGFTISQICEAYGHDSEKVTRIYIDIGESDLKGIGQ
jgi:site-specific recombinase XerD